MSGPPIKNGKSNIQYRNTRNKTVDGTDQKTTQLKEDDQIMIRDDRIRSS